MPITIVPVEPQPAFIPVKDLQHDMIVRISRMSGEDFKKCQAWRVVRNSISNVWYAVPLQRENWKGEIIHPFGHIQMHPSYGITAILGKISIT